MTLLKTLLVPACLLGLSLPAMLADDKKEEKKNEKAKFDIKKLEGKWIIVEGMKNGNKVDGEKDKEPMIVTKDTMTMTADTMKFEFKYTVDDKTDPASIELEIISDTFKGAKAPGIVKLDGDKLMLAYGVNSTEPEKPGKRPTDFTGKKDSEAYSFIYKRAAEEKKDK